MSQDLEAMASNTRRHRGPGIISLSLLTATLALTVPFKSDSWNVDPFCRRGGVEVAAAAGGFDPQNPSYANLALLDFPKEIPGAARVDKYITPGAKYAFVHIRQIHTVPGMTQRQLRDVYRVQRNMYHILDYLAAHAGVNQVLLEGTNQTDAAEINGLIAKRQEEVGFEETLENAMDSREVELQALLASGEGNSETQAELEAIEVTRGQLREKRAHYESNTTWLGKAFMKYGMVVFPTEVDELNAEACSAEEFGPVSQYNEQREDLVLELAAAQGTHLPIVIFGGGHAWSGPGSFGPVYPVMGRLPMKDNIASWNKKHPQHKFSLIEITPEDYVDDGCRY